MPLTKHQRTVYAHSITALTEERTEWEGECAGDYDDARRYYIEDATDEEILRDYNKEMEWVKNRKASPRLL